ncbi:unnamed protein product [Brassica rapa subsp. narinosa]
MEQRRVTGEAPTQKRILLASLSAMVAESVTFPIDLTKTRMQLHGYAPGSASAAHRVGAIGVVSEIMRQEGMMGFYKGLSPAILRHLFYTPIRIIGYENLKGLIVRSEANNGESLPLVTKALLGGLSGVIAQLLEILISKKTYIEFVSFVRRYWSFPKSMENEMVAEAFKKLQNPYESKTETMNGNSRRGSETESSSSLESNSLRGPGSARKDRTNNNQDAHKEVMRASATLENLQLDRKSFQASFQ